MSVAGAPALFRRRPALARRFAHVALGNFPTAVERVDGLLPPTVELWVKREDRGGDVYGGNKVRKLEFLLAEARARGCDGVMTVGGWGSNHALATALYARQLGLACALHLFPQPVTPTVQANLRADVAAGARVHAVSSIAGVAPGIVRARLARATAYVAGGGSSPLGTLGWMSGADELVEQVEAGLPAPDAIYVALGSCGTVAGLLAGLRGAAALAPEIVAVRVVTRVICNARATRALERRTLALTGTDDDGARRAPVALRVEHGQYGRGYGHATPAAEEAVALAAAAGLRLETTYTGKAMAQLIADARSGRLDGKRVLFLHTYSSADLAPLLASSTDEGTLPRAVARLLRR